LLASCLTLLLLLATLLAEDVDSHAYRLATGDRITVTVFGQPAYMHSTRTGTWRI
jgi:polysaccharide export outer membrane protein